MNYLYPLKENESTLHTFCERLTLPYAAAKQYFEQMTPNLEMYELSNYFYTFYSELEDNKRDTVYNNLLRLYECYTEKVEKSKTEFNNSNDKIQSSNVTENSSSTEISKFIFESVSTLSKKFSIYFQHLQRQNILFTFLNVADKYNQISEAVQGRIILKKFDEYDNHIKAINEKIKKKFRHTVIITSLISCLIYMILTKIFLNDNWELFSNIFSAVSIGLFFPIVIELIVPIIKNKD